VVSEVLDNNWVDFFLAAVLIFSFFTGLKTGSASMFFSRYKRSDDAPRFWAGITLSGVGAVVLLTKVAYSVMHL
jgi:hypothetical protein